MSISANQESSEDFALPPAPESQKGPVKAWSEAVNLPSYSPAVSEKYPILGENRVHVALTKSVSNGKAPRFREAIHLENDFIRVMILPDLGGRIDVVLDKTNGYEFSDHWNIAKPDPAASSVSRRVEFNWPQRIPVSTQIEEHADGSRTVWCGAHDEVSRAKGMHGICLYPGRAYIEIKARLFNRTPFVHTFHWRRNAAVSFKEGYDHHRQAAIIHVADSHAGHWSTASFLAPYEAKAFSQFWYPIQKIGPAQKANIDAAVSLQPGSESAQIGVCVTRAFPKATITLEHNGTALAQWTRDLRPGEPLIEGAVLPAGIAPEELTLKALTSAGRPLISYTPHQREKTEAPPTIIEPPSPKRAETVEDLYFIGSRLGEGEDYWREGLRRNPHDSRCNNAMGLWRLRRGDFIEAEAHFRQAIATLTAHNPNPYDSEPFYNLGLALRYQERDDEACEAFSHASQSFAWRAPALFAIAELETKRGNYGIVPKHLHEALRLNADNNNARNLAVVLFRRFGKTNEAEHLLRESLALDPLDAWAAHLSGRPIPGGNQTRLDLAFDYARAGLYEAAIEVLTAVDTFVEDGSLPIVHYALASFYMKTGDLPSAQREYLAASQSSPDYCFPHRLEEMVILARAVALQPHDARAQYYLGNLLYGRGRYEEAMELWESSAQLDGSFAAVWRNLGVGNYNVRGDAPKALEVFDKAAATDSVDARLLYERDQLWKLLGVPPALRLKTLEEHQILAESRADLSVELATLYNNVHQPLRALALLSSGPGPALEQYVRAHLKLGRQALDNGDGLHAQHFFAAALHPGTADVYFSLGEAYNAAKNISLAGKYWRKAAEMPAQPLSETTLYNALALARLGDRFASRRLLRELWYYGRKLTRDKSPRIDYFAESRPAMSLYKDDLLKRRKVTGLFLQAQARFGLGQYKLARRLLDQALALDPNYGRVLDLANEPALELGTK